MNEKNIDSDQSYQQSIQSLELYQTKLICKLVLPLISCNYLQNAKLFGVSSAGISRILPI